MKTEQIAHSIQTINDTLNTMHNNDTLDDNYYLHKRIGTLLYLIVDKTPDCYHRGLIEAIVQGIAEADPEALSLLATRAQHELNVRQRDKIKELERAIKAISDKVKHNERL